MAAGADVVGFFGQCHPRNRPPWLLIPARAVDVDLARGPGCVHVHRGTPVAGADVLASNLLQKVLGFWHTGVRSTYIVRIVALAPGVVAGTGAGLRARPRLFTQVVVGLAGGVHGRMGFFADRSGTDGCHRHRRRGRGDVPAAARDSRADVAHWSAPAAR